VTKQRLERLARAVLAGAFWLVLIEALLLVAWMGYRGAS
jgi:uncharacterized membrane protein